MPIIDLQRRMRQLGEIRLGHVVPTANGKTRPAKLDKFRFTSPSREILTSVAELYGGEVKPWAPANGGPSEFEVYSQANRLPVLIPPKDAVSQWYELYAGSKCVRRCDGQTEHKSDRPCMCDPDDRECAMTTRVNVMLRDVPALGQWLLISKGYYAAVTLPPAAELLSQAGGYVAGWLGMEEKTAIVKDKLARFKVPTLDVEITPAALMAGQITGAPAAVASTQRAAIESAPAQAPGPKRDFLVETKEAATQADALAIFTAAKEAGAPPAYLEQLKAIGLAKPGDAPRQQAEQQEQPHPDDAPREQADEVVDAEIVDPAAAEAMWFQIMAAAGPRGMTTEHLENAFAQRHGGLHPSSASLGQLETFLTALKGGEI
ncbi:recombination directionality factor [Streptomyces bobili]|uniref:recombination directionality factor n=1 Tax=Streptomyces bobili TaxID=67280 RepID=UPI00378CF284